MKNIVLIGSTGSVGLSALDVVRQHRDAFNVVALAANSNDTVLAEQVKEFEPEVVAVCSQAAGTRLQSKLPSSTQLLVGDDALQKVASWKSGELVIAASSGSSSLMPVMEAIQNGKDIGIANKEILVMAGRHLVEAAKKHGVQLLPVDSEHNAIFQCLEGCHNSKDIRKILLTGSGGPFKDMPATDFKSVTPAQAIKHPKWSMGKKISVDSATMMNKGLEIIEAIWLFGVTEPQIEVIVHPEAIVHSMVEFNDGSIVAQMGPTDMKLPLIHVMGYPDRLNHDEFTNDLTALDGLHFSKPDYEKFKCLKIAREVAKHADSTAPVILNAADEVAVHAFLANQIEFTDISLMIEHALQSQPRADQPSLNQIMDADHNTRANCRQWMEKLWV